MVAIRVTLIAHKEYGIRDITHMRKIDDPSTTDWHVWDLNDDRSDVSKEILETILGAVGWIQGYEGRSQCYLNNFAITKASSRKTRSW